MIYRAICACPPGLSRSEIYRVISCTNVGNEPQDSIDYLTGRGLIQNYESHVIGRYEPVTYYYSPTALAAYDRGRSDGSSDAF
jgi:hypothetical protein